MSSQFSESDSWDDGTINPIPTRLYHMTYVYHHDDKNYPCLVVIGFNSRKTRLLSDQCRKIDRLSFPTTAKHVWSILSNTFFGHDKFTQRSFPYSVTRRNMQQMQRLHRGFESWMQSCLPNYKLNYSGNSCCIFLSSGFIHNYTYRIFTNSFSPLLCGQI